MPSERLLVNKPSDWDVYLVTDRSLLSGRSLLSVVHAAVEGGVSVVQLREKILPTRAFYEQGIEIRDYLRSRGIPLLINDRIDIALALDADGVHLGRDDMPPEIARRLMGPDRIIGLSVNEPAHLTEGTARCADYLAVSPVFFTPTKEDITTPWELEGLRRARALTDMPLVAIGGIKRANSRQVTEWGADCVAVVSEIMAAEDPREASRALVEEVREGKLRRACQSPHL
ncbi:MAG: thiamine phosphate synthase [Thermodesulfobacteriota bacterium]